MTKYPINFLFFLVAYALILLYGFNNIIYPVVADGFLKYTEFQLMTLLILLPLILLFFYLLDSKVPLLKRHENMMRWAITISVAAAGIAVFLFLVPGF